MQGKRSIFISRLTILGLIILLGSAPTVHADSIKLTLEEAIGLGLANSTMIKSKTLSVLKARAELQAARSGYFPDLSAGAAYTHLFENDPSASGYMKGSDPVSFSLDVSQTVFTFGKIKNSVHMAREGLKSAELNLMEEKRDLIIQIKRAFYGYILAEEVVKINEATLASRKDALDVAQKKYKAGISSDFEVLQKEADVEAFKPSVISSQNQVKIALLTVKDLLGIEGDDDTEIELIGTLETEYFDFQKEELVRTALANKYDIKNLQHTRRLLEIQKKLNRAARLPNVAAFLGYSLDSGFDRATGKSKYSGEDAWDGKLAGGVTVQIPVSSFFPWSEESANIKKSALDIEDLNLSYDSLVSSTKTRIESILLTLEEEKLKIASGEKGLELSKRLYNSATEQYARGLISSIELKDAELGLNSAQLTYIEAVFNHKMALIDLMDAIGVDHF